MRVAENRGRRVRTALSHGTVEVGRVIGVFARGHAADENLIRGATGAQNAAVSKVKAKIRQDNGHFAFIHAGTDVSGKGFIHGGAVGFPGFAQAIQFKRRFDGLGADHGLISGEEFNV